MLQFANFCLASTGKITISLFLLIGISHAHGEVEMQSAGNGTTALHEPDYPPTYFGLSDHGSLIYGHISLMILAWVFLLPVGECLFDKTPLCTELNPEGRRGDTVSCHLGTHSC